MNSFIQYVLYELTNSIGLIIPAGILAAIVILISYLLFKKKHKGEKKFPLGRIFMYTHAQSLLSYCRSADQSDTTLHRGTSP